MADERELIEERQKKVAEIRALGGKSICERLRHRRHTAAEILARFAGRHAAAEPPEETTGSARPAAADRRRLRGRRPHHVGCSVLRQGGVRDAAGPQRPTSSYFVQQGKLRGEEKYAHFKELDIGDIIYPLRRPAHEDQDGRVSIIAESLSC